MAMTQQTQSKLDKFIVNNTDLDKLTTQLSEFNLFRVLGIEHMEIRHSNVLAWLLDPSEAHGLGAIFLRRVLTTLLLESAVPGVDLKPAEVELMSLDAVEVYRERHNIDILVRCSVGRWCLLIENKIHAKESGNQLSVYRTAVTSEFQLHEIIPIFLTLDGEDPSEAGLDAGYVPMSHGDILKILTAIIDEHGARIPSDARVFLNHYVTSLKRLMMDEDPATVELCKAIYRKHREAIDLIVELGGANEIHEICERAIKELVPCQFTHIGRGNVWFAPKDVMAVMPQIEMAGWDFLPTALSVPVCFWFRYSKRRQRLKLTLEVGPIADISVRKNLLKTVEAHGLPVAAKQFETTKYTRLVSESKKLRDGESGRPGRVRAVHP